jgi:alpha-N-arabinofuranosidase
MTYKRISLLSALLACTADGFLCFSNLRAEPTATVTIHANAQRTVVSPSLYGIFLKVYVGEYRCNRLVGEGNMMAALAEAAYLLGLERNGDVVTMTSYAPLLFHVDDIAWPVNLIGFDSSRVAPRASYYVQKILSANRPDGIVQTQITPATEAKSAELFALAGIETQSGDVLLRVVNRSATPQEIRVKLQGLAAITPLAKVTTLSSDDPQAENTVDYLDAILPVESAFAKAGADFAYTFKPYSFTLLRIKTAKTKD